jgi:hypothetical protein
MHRSSENVAALATALAKAQMELINPEKLLTASVQTGSETQTFRYASLASGLDIVRKTLGRHEIATIQTTAIDQPTGTIRLTTLLAHASGEWISSDWPVCPLADTAIPRRMGAALTYARRYALFTLVGIAGEDDVDAPDLRPEGKGCGDPSLKLEASALPLENRPRPWASRGAKPFTVSPLRPAGSAALRDRLLQELLSLGSPEEACVWAKRILPAKNTLTAADAVRVEEEFQKKTATFGLEEAAPTIEVAKPLAVSRPKDFSRPKDNKSIRSSVPIDKTVLMHGEPRRYRNKEHLQFVASKPCLVCGRQPCDPHHLRFAQRRALGRKVSDEFTVPLCRGHHRELHRASNEAAWWKKVGVRPLVVALELWKQTRLIVDLPTAAGFTEAVAQPKKSLNRVGNGGVRI